jgi:MoaA/NifB/PqqE/SkfB family radical SAM enzyme
MKRISAERTALETVIPLATPFIIYIDPSDRCNFQCSFCPTGDRNLMKNTTGRNHGLLDFELYQKIIDDLGEFAEPIKVIRLYKDGEPLIHPRFADMIRYAKASGFVGRVDTTTNASLLTPEKNLALIEAGLDRINISIYGVNSQHYLNFTKFKIDMDKLVANIRHLYEHRAQCEVVVKISGDFISPAERQTFLDIFKEGMSGLDPSIEHTMACWSGFDFASHGIEINQDQGIYGQLIQEVSTCPYVFYSFAINSSGIASLCFLDWQRKLTVGNLRTSSVKSIWNDPAFVEHRKMMLRGDRKSHPVCGPCGQMSHGQPDNIDPYAVMLLEKIQG